MLGVNGKSVAMNFPLPTMESVLHRNIRRRFLSFSSASTLRISTPVLVLDYPFVSESWNAMAAGFGRSPKSEKDLPSASPSEDDRSKGKKPFYILVAEDNEGDAYLIRSAIKTAGVDATIRVVRDGEAATDIFDHADADATQPCPSLLILDLNLPKKRGTQVLAHLRKSRRCNSITVIVVSSTGSLVEMQNVLDLGANAFFQKVSQLDDFMKLGDVVKRALSPA